MKIKVCGVTNCNDIHALTAMNIDFMGFIFYEKSPRYALQHLSLNSIKAITTTKKVGVFVNEKTENIVQIVQEASLDMIQLHGDENDVQIQQLSKTFEGKIDLIKAVRIGKQTTAVLQHQINSLPEGISAILFDTDSENYGGTGKAFSWQILDQLEITKPYFLSGGISLENHKYYKCLVNQPFALDVNSKFELSPGKKNLSALEILIENLNK
ncbi:phosphoribosylanthranilate isomerase [Chryseobacterium sp. 6424]|uniref:phosphoribosylanthranilate isomerase n=1 Tax=Chryseobacterium sp. 6424 TaxID=2039166 RepID=UPI000EFC990D|nr:phosphoribosylanthranilate isomerase [Chryseobacterium sp. 6424]AYO57506.1 phosphoribosylanthranilate isomerase [Chryseobacterium sp. 6424]